MAPSRPNRWLLRTCALQQWQQWVALLVSYRTRKGEVVRQSVTMNQAEDELRRRDVTRNANDHAVDGLVSLYLNPAIGSTGWLASRARCKSEVA
jgi:hypothetical protein